MDKTDKFAEKQKQPAVQQALEQTTIEPEQADGVDPAVGGIVAAAAVVQQAIEQPPPETEQANGGHPGVDGKVAAVQQAGEVPAESEQGDDGNTAVGGIVAAEPKEEAYAAPAKKRKKNDGPRVKFAFGGLLAPKPEIKVEAGG